MDGNRSGSAEPGTRLLVLGYRGKSVPSRLIEWQTWSPYSHVALGVAAAETPWTQAHTIEAWTSGVRWQPDPFHGHTRGTRVDAFLVPIEDPAVITAAWRYAFACLGRPYDWGGVLRFVPRFGRDNPNRLFCSELVAEALASVGLRLLRRIDASRISPGALLTSPILLYVSSADSGRTPPVPFWDPLLGELTKIGAGALSGLASAESAGKEANHE